MAIGAADQIAIGSVTNKQIQRIGGLVQSFVPQIMLWQRTASDVIGFSTGAADLVVPTIMEVPVAPQLGTTRTTIKALLDLLPRRPAMLLHILVGDLVRDALIADRGHQPVEHRAGVAIADCRTDFVGSKVSPDLID